MITVASLGRIYFYCILIAIPQFLFSLYIFFSRTIYVTCKLRRFWIFSFISYFLGAETDVKVNDVTPVVLMHLLISRLVLIHLFLRLITIAHSQPTFTQVQVFPERFTVTLYSPCTQICQFSHLPSCLVATDVKKISLLHFCRGEPHSFTPSVLVRLLRWLENDCVFSV